METPPPWHMAICILRCHDTAIVIRLMQNVGLSTAEEYLGYAILRLARVESPYSIMLQLGAGIDRPHPPGMPKYYSAIFSHIHI